MLLHCSSTSLFMLDIEPDRTVVRRITVKFKLKGSRAGIDPEHPQDMSSTYLVPSTQL